MPTALAISPHLDDAVFSAGGMLARMAREGWRVIVATVFTASVPDPQGFALACQLDKGLSAEIDYMALRRSEDARACAAVGAEPLWLPFAEAPHRGYASAAELFGPMRDDDAIVAAISPALRDLVSTLAPDTILGPQAIGAHVDHVAVFEAVRSLRRAPRLWADFPYAAGPGLRASPFAGEIAGCREEIADLADEDIEAKTAGILAYASQLGFQFGGPDGAIDFMGRHGKTETFRHAPRGPAPSP